MMRDMKNNLDVVGSLAPAARVNGTANGTGVDLKGFNSCMAVFHAGAVTDGVHTPKVQESDDDSTYTDVAAADLLGTLAAFTANTVQRIGYIGNKRYIRPVITTTGATTGALSNATVVRGNPHVAPVA